ncbi:MAG: hypothetical protein ABMA13_20680 [Chthoniobacteraceae bacterium]
MSLLFLAGESDADEEFYASCAEKITSRAFQRIPLRNRKGSGVESVRKQMRNGLKMARAAAHGQESVAFIAAMDNDRAPHPENEARPPVGTGLDRALLVGHEADSPERLGWMQAVVEEVLTSDRSKWPLDVALALPVEMIESWIVRVLCDACPQPMPHFSRSDSQGVREYYAQSVGGCPPQWKDLAEAEHAALEHREDRRFTKREFYEYVMSRLDADALAKRSLSFRMFKEWLEHWTT